MPLHRVSGGGWEYGHQKKYRGKGAKRKAIKQMYAIKASEARRGHFTHAKMDVTHPLFDGLRCHGCDKLAMYELISDTPQQTGGKLVCETCV